MTFQTYLNSNIIPVGNSITKHKLYTIKCPDIYLVECRRQEITHIMGRQNCTHSALQQCQHVPKEASRDKHCNSCNDEK